MNEKTQRVFNGWVQLSSAERRDFQDAIRDYESASDSRKTEIRESMRKSATKMQTGPLGGGCPCCGR
jgi:uncharacterized protein Yka (UPF0111/DUF47 family)